MNKLLNYYTIVLKMHNTLVIQSINELLIYTWYGCLFGVLHYISKNYLRNIRYELLISDIKESIEIFLRHGFISLLTNSLLPNTGIIGMVIKDFVFIKTIVRFYVTMLGCVKNINYTLIAKIYSETVIKVALLYLIIRITDLYINCTYTQVTTLLFVIYNIQFN